MVNKKPLRIFISSPGDVRPERHIAERVIARLAREFAYHFDIETILWEREPLVATEHFQTSITPPSETDIAVVILWSRLGTPLPREEFAGAVSGGRVTGTEWEFEDAVAANRRHGRPDLLLYRKDAPVLASLEDDAELERRREQKRRVERFMRRWFVDDASGTFKAASRLFTRPDEFEAMLEEHLRELLRQRLDMPEAQVGLAGIHWHSGSPYRGLESFDVQHAPIFFGRTRARNELREALMRQSARGRAFVLVLGASGSGKSSLVKAGLLPDITLPGMIGNVGLCRYAICRPGDSALGPTRSLADALFQDTALPELAEQEYTAEQIADQLAKAPEHVPVRQCLALAGKSAALTERAEARLCIVLDQLEELFTLEGITRPEQQTFVDALDALARSGSAWIVATMRSDFFDRLESLPALASLSGDGRYLLEPPDEAELGQVIREPAREAGLRFEADAERGVGLDDVIRQSASRDPSALPLLEFLLDQLWHLRTENGVITFAAYERLGGLEGALSRRAEEEHAKLPDDQQAVFPAVLRALVAVGQGEQGETTARRVPLENFSAESAERRLIEAFLDPAVRLLVADGDGKRATVRVAHEALLSHWPRAAEQILRDRSDLQVRGRLEQAESRWRRAEPANRASLLLNPGLPLSEALDLLARRGQELAPELREFVESSERAAERAARSRLRRAWTAATVMGGLAFLAVGFGWYGLDQKSKAQARQREALVAESQSLAALSRLRTEEGETGDGIRLALKALPRDLAEPDRPYVPEAESSLYLALANHRRLAVFDGHSARIDHAAFSPDGRRAVSASLDGTARVWDVDTRTTVAVLQAGSVVTHAAFSRDGRRVVTASRDGMARLWDAETGDGLPPLEGHEDSVFHAAFSPDGRSILTVSLDGTARLWSTDGGEQTLALEAQPPHVVTYAAFSPDGRRIVTTSSDGTAALLDVERREGLAGLVGHADSVFHASFSPDGRRVVTGSRDGAARLWDAETGEQQLPVLPHATEGFAVLYAAFSPDGRRIVTTLSDRTVRLWDSASGKLVEVFDLRSEDDGGLPSATFSPDGRRVLTWLIWGRTARLWNAETGDALAEFRGLGIKFTHAVFSPDGERILTGSVDGKLWLWDATSGLASTTLEADGRWGFCDGFSPDGQLVITLKMGSRVSCARGEFDAVLRARSLIAGPVPLNLDDPRARNVSGDVAAWLWEIETGKTLAVLEHDSIVTHAAFSPDGRRVVTASEDGTVRLWDAHGTELPVLRGHTDKVNEAAFSPDGQVIVTASDDDTARLWDVTTGEAVAVLREHDGAVTRAAFSPDGRRVVTASWDDTARLWDAETGAAMALFAVREINHAELSPDGLRVVTASEDETVRLWDARSGAELDVLQGHSDRVVDAAFSPDSGRIVTASWDGTARLWDVHSGDLLAVFDHPHALLVTHALFSPDGRRVLTLTNDHGARIWPVLPHGQALIERARVIAPENEAQNTF